jgi:NOL1/NOP2/fmu family ribosome biogenesis protein
MFLEQVISQTSGSIQNPRILDLCAAPGGKSTLLSDIIGHGGLLVANEAIRSRAVILAETLTKWGVVNSLVTQNDPSSFGRLPGYFDIILVDAPCSGEGMFRSNIAINEWSPGNTAHCAERQKRILMDVWPSLKESGILVYSTCTFNSGENEENIKWLIEKNQAECLRIDLSDYKGITEIDFENIFGYGFYPDNIRGEGFFISAIRKTGKQESPRIKSQRKAELNPGKSDLEAVITHTGFSKERIFRLGDEIFAVPCSMDDYLHLYTNLKIIKAGTRLFSVKNNKYLPSHELALSQQFKVDAFPRYEIGLPEALSFMRRDNFILKDAVKGWVIVNYKGINIGFVNNLGNRVNNYFPVEWRIRMNLPEAGNENLIKWDKNK